MGNELFLLFSSLSLWKQRQVIIDVACCSVSVSVSVSVSDIVWPMQILVHLSNPQVLCHVVKLLKY
jgi:hypothetical protein